MQHRKEKSCKVQTDFSLWRLLQKILLAEILFSLLRFMFTKQPNKGAKMGKLETVSAQKSAVQSGQEQALVDGLGVCYDQGALDQKGLDGTLNQGDLDKAVSDALAAAKLVSDAALAAEHQASVEALAALQKSLDELTVKEQLEEAVVADVVAKINQVQEAFDRIKALFNP